MCFGLPCKDEEIGELKSLTQGPRAADGVQWELSFPPHHSRSKPAYTMWFSWELVFTRLPRWLSVKESACSAGDVSSIPRSEKFPGEGNGNPCQYSCLENPMDKGAWWATVHGVTKVRPQLNNTNNVILHKYRKAISMGYPFWQSPFCQMGLR